MLWGLFEKYTSTSDGTKNKKFPSIKVHKSSITVFSLLKEELKKEGFYEITANEEYLDLFGIKQGFELSIQIAQNGLDCFVNMSVFGENKRGRTRKFFKRYYNKFKQILE